MTMAIHYYCCLTLTHGTLFRPCFIFSEAIGGPGCGHRCRGAPAWNAFIRDEWSADHLTFLRSSNAYLVSILFSY